MPGSGSTSRGGRRRRPRPWGLVALAVAALVVAGAAGWLARTNHDRAADWRDRALVADRQAARLNRLLIRRSETLDARVRQLNSTASELLETRQALGRSEGDVEDLERRQRELAAEKAAVEDGRALLEAEREALRARQRRLEGVASAFVECNARLLELLDAVAADDADRVTAIQGDAETVCTDAEGRLDEYLTAEE